MHWWILYALGAYVAYRFIQNRASPQTFPDPRSHILQPDDVIAEHMLDVEGVVNFRDIGGYETHDGHIVRKGRVYRSGSLSGMTDAGWQAVESLGIRLICDMRSDDEVADAPDNLPEGHTIQQRHLPLVTEDSTFERLMTVLFNKQRIQTTMPDTYRTVIIDNNAHLFKEIFEHLADEDNLPTLIHCTAGKDRTGVAVALLLATLGVPDETIIADYTVSNRFYQTYHAFAANAVRKVRWLGVSADDLHPLLLAQAETLGLTLDHVRATYGSVAGYLTDHAGLSAATLDRLRDQLLE